MVWLVHTYLAQRTLWFIVYLCPDMMKWKGRASRKLFVNDIILKIGLDASVEHLKELFAVNMHATPTANI